MADGSSAVRRASSHVTCAWRSEAGVLSISFISPRESRKASSEAARMRTPRLESDSSGDTSGLAQQRAEVKREFDRAYSQVLDDTGDRED